MEFEKVIKNRKATRRFSDKPISQEVLNNILEAGRLAPTARNIQPIKIYIVSSEGGLKVIDKASPCRYNAPVVLIICGNKKEAFKKGNHSTYEIDSSIVATHIMLAATDNGVSNIWIDMFDRDILKKELKIDDDFIPVCMMPIGYKSKVCPPSPFHKIRKNIKKIVEYR